MYNAPERIRNKNLLISETTAYQNYRNENKCKINWNFTKENADEKLSKYYICNINSKN
jgi:hypothetical protein